MKRTLALIGAMVIFLNASAQISQKESYLFNHWSVGLGVGLTEGTQITVGTTVLPTLQLRMVYNTVAPVLSLANGIVDKFVPEDTDFTLNPLSMSIKGINLHSTSPQIDLDEVLMEGSQRNRNLSLLADYFPSAKSTFHLTAGLIFNLQAQQLSLTGSMKNENGGPAVDPSNFAATEFYGITTDLEGKIHIGSQYGMKILQPYLGIGFGHAVNTKRRFGFNFDLGVIYVGGVHLMAKNYYENPDKPVDVELNKAWIDANPDIKDALGDEYADTTKWLDFANSFPVLPVLRFTLSYRLF